MCCTYGLNSAYPLNINDQIKFETINYSSLSDKAWLLKSETETSIFNKISNNDKLKDICEGIYQGLITTGDDIFMVEGEIVDEIFYGFSKALNESIELESGLLKEVLKGQDINRYLPLKSNKYVIYPHLLDEDNKTIPIEEVDFRNNFPKTYAYLTTFRDHLTDKKIRYKTNPKYWYSLHRAREISIFEKDYLITPQLQNYPNFTVKETNVYADAGGYLIVPKKDLNPLDLLVILNSKLLWYFIKNTSSEYSGGYFYFKTKYLEPFGIPINKLINFEFTDLANNQLNQTKNLFKLINKLLRNLKRQFPEELEKLPKNLQNWNELSYSGFIKELKKKKIKLSLSQEAEWEEYFLSEQEKAKNLKTQIDQTDKEIDQMVYELYELTEEEIEIVENS